MAPYRDDNLLRVTKMDRNKFTEITIFEPAAGISMPDTVGPYSAKTLNTIPEHRSSNACQPYEDGTTASKNLRSSVERRADTIETSSTPLDIDLLLRCYANNSSMEKSINKMFEISDERYSNRPDRHFTEQISQDAGQESLIELGAACKICESLKRTTSRNDSYASFRVQDILAKLRSLAHKCHGKTLNQLITTDPTLSRCPHCGVISRYAKSVQVNSAESRSSQPKMSYFLSTQMFPDIDISGIDDAQPFEGVTRLDPRKERSTQRADKYRNAQKRYSRLPCRLQKDRDKSSESTNLKVDREPVSVSNTVRGMESMEAERDNANEAKSDQNKAELSHRDRNSNRSSSKSTGQSTQKLGSSRLVMVSSSLKDRADIKNDSIASSKSHKFERYYNDGDNKDRSDDDVSRSKRNRWGWVMRRQLTEECSEKVMNEILYEASKSPLDDFEPHTCMSLNSRQSLTDTRQNRSTSVFKEPLSTGATTHLSNRGRCGESIDNGRDGSVTRLKEKARLQSHYLNDRHSFAMYGSMQRKQGLNSEFWVPDKLIRSLNAIEDNRGDNALKASKHPQDSKHYDQKDHVKSNPQDSSTTCSMEKDSLENCVKGSGRSLKCHRESSVTMFSSSSAENMIREWVNHPRASDESTADETCEKLNALKPSIAQLNIEPEKVTTDEQPFVYRVRTSIVNRHSFETRDATKSRSAKLTDSQEKLQRWSKHVDDRSRTSNDRKFSEVETRSTRSNKDCGNERKKRFGQQLLDSFKRITSSKSVIKTKEHCSSAKSMKSGNWSADASKNIARRIIYNETSLKGMLDANGRNNRMEDVLLVYRRILDSTKEMNWKSFQRFVEELHPNQKDLWKDICNAVDNEVKRMNGENEGQLEISIEITSIPFEKPSREESVCSNEIMFEMDITLGDIEKCFARQLPCVGEVQLDTLKEAGEVIKV